MKKIKVAINGFGRIGRAIFRILSDREDIEVVAINDITDFETLAYLLRYDTVFGHFPGDVVLQGRVLTAGKHKPRLFIETDVTKLPWKDLGVDYAIESTGKFRKAEQISQHLESGAKKVILTVPAKDDIGVMVVLGVNDQVLRPEHKIISNASCTTNCLAPVAKVLHERFGILKGYMTTVHAYTNDQRLGDIPHSELRRSRAAAENVIPTTTGAARAVGKVLPELNGKLDGIAMRVPVANGSTVDLVVQLAKQTDTKAINAAMKEAASRPPLKGVLEYTEEPIVSSDIIGNPHSSIFDGLSTRVLGENFVKVVSWYDNEWGYSCRIVDLIQKLATMEN
ncbi:MAG: type I glyceraldehyde-3-phosphate dehydrogenase [Acidobacteriota bacterium]